MTRAANASQHFTAAADVRVMSRPELIASGCGKHELVARIAAGRWQRVGRAVVLHNAPLSRHDGWRVAIVNCGPRAVLTSFTGLEMVGLTGWERDEIHVLAPEGVAEPRLPGIRLVLHRTTLPIDQLTAMRTHRPAPAGVIAAASFTSARPAIGLMAALVQQRLVSTAQLDDALSRAPRTRHRAILKASVDDIAMGAQALSEIDFANLCRRHGLPMPSRQAVRTEPSGRRRYLDAEWRLRDGRRVAAEIDGAVHLAPRRWFDDQLRQNEITLTGTTVLRFPAAIVRTEPALVATQLRRALGIPHR